MTSLLKKKPTEGKDAFPQGATMRPPVPKQPHEIGAFLNNFPYMRYRQNAFTISRRDEDLLHTEGGASVHRSIGRCLGLVFLIISKKNHLRAYWILLLSDLEDVEKKVHVGLNRSWLVGWFFFC